MKWNLLVCIILFYFAGGQTDVAKICRKADVVFVVDASGSVKYANWLLALQFVQSVVSNLSSHTSDMRYGFIRFESIAEEMFSLDTYNNNTAATLNAIHKIDYPYDRDTNISGAIWKMHDMFTRKARKGVTKVGIFISDGESKIDGQYVAQYAREAREDKITIIVIAITGLWLQLDELKLIASEHKHKQLLHNITTYSELNSQLEEIVADTCQATEDSTPKSFCEENKDILFLIDGSIISYQDVLKVKSFLKSFSLGVSLNSSRIGVIVYSNVVEYKIPLSIFNSSKTFSDMVDTITVQNNQRADLAEALKTAGKILNLDYRQRIVIIITNRGSSEEKAAIENAVFLRTNMYILVEIMVIGKWISKYELYQVASYPTDQSLYFLNSYDELVSRIPALQQSFCRGKTFCQNKVCMNNGYCGYDYLTYYCGCTDGFGSFDCRSRCQLGDVIIGVETSKSLNPELYSQHVIKFIRLLMHHGQTLTNVLNMMVRETNGNQNVLTSFDISNAWDSIQLLKMLSFYEKNSLSNMFANGISFFEKYGNKQRNKFFVIISFGQLKNLYEDFKYSATVRKMGITILYVTVQLSEYSENLEQMNLLSSNLNGKNTFVAKTFDALNEEVLPKVIESLCNSQNDCSSSRCRDGSTCVDKINGFECICAPTQSGEFCDKKCAVKYDIVFVIDKSNDMRPERFAASLDFMKTLISYLNVGDNGSKIALVTFSDTAVVEFNLNSYMSREDVVKALYFPKYTYGKANLAQALREIRQNIFLPEKGDRPNAANFVVIMTTGSVDTNDESIYSYAVQLKNMGTRLLAVKIGEGQVPLEFSNIVNYPPDEHIFLSTSFRSLNAELADRIMTNIICPEFDPCLSNRCDSGSTCVSHGKSYDCICPPGKTGPFCNESCLNKADVVLALDLSGSLAESFNDILLFSRTLVNNLVFYPSRNEGTKLALLTYSDKSYLVFNFDQYNDKPSVLNALNLHHINGRTNTASVFKMTLDDVLHSSANRQDATDHVVIVTDGNSNINVPQTTMEAGKLKMYGAKMTVVAVEDFDGINKEEIDSLASSPIDSYRFVLHKNNRLNEINDITRRIAFNICGNK